MPTVGGYHMSTKSEPKAPRITLVGGGVAGLILATRLGHLISYRVSSPGRPDRPRLEPRCTPSLRAPGTSTNNRCNMLRHARTHDSKCIPAELDAIGRVDRIRLGGGQLSGRRVQRPAVPGISVGANQFGDPAALLRRMRVQVSPICPTTCPAFSFILEALTGWVFSPLAVDAAAINSYFCHHSAEYLQLIVAPDLSQGSAITSAKYGTALINLTA